ncbi:MAG: AmmeMemoRadiSam system protein A [Synergistaceae bacterium]|jgi:AmmeMemoRadiSam system protein A|nr:AmmeMemoRadiSam system protein A [Synergistaceae bacterium]
MSEKNHPYVRLARVTVERLLGGKPLPASGAEVALEAEQGLWSPKRACFVSIKTFRGDLRGCIGTLLPASPRLDLEIISNAVAASTRDPRFSPMVARELEETEFSVDVLSPPESVMNRGELDPIQWGVIVSRGPLRGVLLPDLEGVDTVERQLDIAARKAGMRSAADIAEIERFRVERYKEKAHGL